MRNKIVNFHNIKFYDLNYIYLAKSLLNKGGYIVAPAASSLSKIFHRNKRDYYRSLKESTFAIYDSGYFCLLLNLLLGIRVKKFSGYLLVRKVLNSNFFKPKKTLLIDPDYPSSIINKKMLIRKGFKHVFNYIAPRYNRKSLLDKNLFKKIKKNKISFIIINIGGEKQEILANIILKNIKFKLSIICTGAAIAFLTKRQAPINPFIDKFYLGWLVRLIYSPKIFYKRVIQSIKLINLFFNKNSYFPYLELDKNNIKKIQ